jgi:cleavage stimulation factor subunit 2
MFELMQQMKQCIQNNPNESRQMLMQNPQLAYALLQALVVMRVVDPVAAVSMLQKGGGQADVIGMGPPAGGPMYSMPKPSFPVGGSEPWMGAGPPMPRPSMMGNLSLCCFL